MAIRVTQHTMYNNMVNNMQTNLGAYMESVQQGSTQKKINRPSDDPAGTYRVLTTRVDLTNTAQYQENVDTAKGWLNLADNVLSTQVTTAITGLKTLAEQASTGTYTAAQRRIMADQARQYFGQLLNLSNTEFEGKSIFAGHAYDKNAFEQGLTVTVEDKNRPEDEEFGWTDYINAGGVKVEGASDTTVLVQFLGEDVDGNLQYIWSNDAGDNWSEPTTAELDDNKNIQLKPAGAGVTITIQKEIMVDGKPQTPPKFTQTVQDQDRGPSNGTMMYVRPTAFYQGDDKDPPVDVTLMGAGNLTKDNVSATGSFGSNVLVRIDGERDGNGGYTDVTFDKAGKSFDWSYSTDGGVTWTTLSGQTTSDGKLRLPIPGGYIDFDASNSLDAAGNKMLKAGAQAMVHPSRADLNYEIMKDTYLSVNSVGKDVFGGYYEGKPALDGDNNLFEVVGAFIGYLEGNSQEGCQRTLAALTTCEEQILREATRIGGMENRVEMAEDVLSYQKLDQEERLSYVEDIDLTELLTKLTRQQITYQTVLQSSSMIMQLSLANYI